ncbi:hypothetical protein JOF56_008316 [Kibdelosporangium banguiense]|uniref:Secreted protein n=1 Tax=Kibdelosporangium banguiense TaxID=1365924 RepID=A0ABS4TU32_9PSEU|nr:hypothetical protein [Kibdelosporangium banguiense]MBP2327931.1 hypothetical protein [Kibdelosporangium banguiense]
MRRTLTVLAMIAATSLASTGVSDASQVADPDDEAGTLGGCVANVCGSVMNESNHVIWAIKDWGNGGPAPGTEFKPLQPNEQTPPNEDWDGVYVECNASGRLATWVPPVWVWKDFTVPARWAKKIATNEDAHIRGQSC